MSVDLPGFLAAVCGGVVEAQSELDERGLDSIDAFQDTGIPPTVLTCSSVGVRVPVAMRVLAKDAPDRATGARVSLPSEGGATLTVRLRYLISAQGVDDPYPLIAAGRQESER